MKASRLQREIYRSMVDTAGDVVVVADEAGKILTSNDAAVTKVFGFLPKEVIGLDIRDLLPEARGTPHGAPESIDMIRYRATNEGVVSHGRTVTGRRKDGSAVALDLSIAEWRDKAAGRCFTWVMRDVSERERLRVELAVVADKAADAARVEHQLLGQVRESNEELKVANEGLQKFTSIVAHDLRGPLRRIEAFVGVLQKEFAPKMDAEGVDILARIAGGAERMKQMLDSLLQYSRYNSAAIAGKTARLADVVRDALTAFDVAALGIDLKISVNDVPDVEGDTVLLSHVLQNLIGNSIKFRNTTSPQIAIAAWPDDGKIFVSVADNGLGVEPRFADKIFEMFYRLHDDDEYEGAGIGLTVCRKIVNDHGGRIWLDTEFKGGTQFIFTLQAAAADTRPTPNPKPRSSGGRALTTRYAEAPEAQGAGRASGSQEGQPPRD